MHFPDERPPGMVGRVRIVRTQKIAQGCAKTILTFVKNITRKIINSLLKVGSKDSLVIYTRMQIPFSQESTVRMMFTRRYAMLTPGASLKALINKAKRKGWHIMRCLYMVSCIKLRKRPGKIK